tara:strand:- start:88 stop:558 length:471 start_codon:yes stop_codon:yes gene_type:complete
MDNKPDFKLAGVMITNPSQNLFYFQLKDETYHIEELRHAYTVFGGSIEKGEKDIDAMKRELFEELDINAAKLIEEKIKFVFKGIVVLKHRLYKGKLLGFSLFESILSNENLIKISKLPVKEGERGSLIKKEDIGKNKFNPSIKEIIVEYFQLKDYN